LRVALCSDCDVDDPWTTLTISRLKSGCNHLKHRFSDQDIYTDFVHSPLNTSKDYPPLEFLGLYCDSACKSCTAEIGPQPYGKCVPQSSIGSVSLYPEEYYCKGSPNRNTNQEGISIFYYELPQCSMKLPADDGNVLYIRNHGKPSNTCVEDGKGTPQLYYQLNETRGAKGPIFNGKLRCTDDKCSEGCITITDLAQGACHQATEMDNHGVEIWRSKEVLDQCENVPQSGPSPPGPKPTQQPATDADPELVAGLVGGGVALAAVVFGASLCYRHQRGPRLRGDGVSVRYSAASRVNPQYERMANAQAANPSYGTLTADEEGMTTDI
jgi:hypothetical protein